MNKRQIYEYYSSEFISGQLLENSRSREVAGAFWDGSYDKRPNILQYKTDVAQMVRNGVTSFHFSVERWSNPMALQQGNYDKLRTGWDAVIDIDSKIGVGEARLAATMVCELLEKYGIRSYGTKFSGNRGFHICLPWEVFPKTINYKPAEKLYPLLPRIITGFIRKKLRKRLLDELVRTKGAKNLMEILGEKEISPYFFVNIEKGWGARHMYRAPYSLNEKKWLASVPLSSSQLEDFSTDIADPDYVTAHSDSYSSFLKPSAETTEEASDLVTEAMDWHASLKKEEPARKRRIVVWDRKISEEHFPPCMKNILAGLADGRKRSIFTLINFLKMMNWKQNEIEQKIFEWNEKNKPPLPRSTLLSTIRYHEKRGSVPPPNCPPDGDLYYLDTIDVCRPDRICTAGTSKIMIKNPIVYPFKAVKRRRVYRGFSCGVCSKEFRSMRSLNMHKSRVHGYVFEA